MKSISQHRVVNYSLTEIHGSASQRMDETRMDFFCCGLNDDCYESLSGMLLWLKGVAIDHYSSKASSKNFRESWSQILNARKVLNLINAEAPWKRRKLIRVRGKMKATSDLLLEKPNEQSTTKRGKCSFASSFSCLINCADSEESSDQILQNPHGSVRSSVYADTLSRKWIPNGRCFQPSVLDNSQSNDEVLPLLDSDNSISGSNLSNPTKSVLQTPHKSVKLLKSVNHDQRKFLYTSLCKEVPPLFNLDEAVKNSSNSLSSNNPRKRKTPQRPVKLWNFIDDYHSRMAIPVGPRFQAGIPDLICLANRGNMSDGDANSDNSEKWLGTRIWPIEGTNAEISREVIGKGRPCSCSCRSPGSPRCIKHHVIEKRLRLQLDLTSAFFSWKFDEMGEEVSSSWSLKEQKSFTDLVKMNPV